MVDPQSCGYLVLTSYSQVETYQLQEGKNTHGYSGPLKVSLNATPSSVARDFLDAHRKYDTVRKLSDDANDLSARNVITVSHGLMIGISVCALIMTGFGIYSRGQGALVTS